MLEKEKLTKQLAQIDPKKNEWSKVVCEAFEYSLLAKERFETGSSEDKKVIFKAIGVNPKNALSIVIISRAI
jgi:SMC interacting uncharacterized protein involved in chromosome segregation